MMILVDFLRFQLSVSLDNYCLISDVTLASEDEYNKCVLGSDIVITVNGTDYVLFVEDKQKSANVSGRVHKLTCVSPAVKLDKPYQKTLIKEYPSDILASDIIMEMASYADLSVDYQAYDWVIPGNTFYVIDKTPLEVIRTITEVIGAVIQSKPNGELLIISRYSISPKDWEASIPEEVLTFSDDIIDFSEDEDIREGYNAFLLTDNTGVSGKVTLREKDINRKSKYVQAYQVPFTGTPFELKSSGGPEVTIIKDPLVPVEETIPVVENENDEEWEIVEFIEWTGKTSLPIYSIIEYDWAEEDLGSFSFTQDGTLTIDEKSSVPSESLLKIKYKTKYWRWIVQVPSSRYVQFYVEPLL